MAERWNLKKWEELKEPGDGGIEGGMEGGETGVGGWMVGDPLTGRG